jgi:hypothetical protein
VIFLWIFLAVLVAAIAVFAVWRWIKRNNPYI